MKKIVKRISKFFITLNEEYDEPIRQSILIVDNGYSWLGQLDSCIKRIKNYFPKSDISVLSFTGRKNNLQKDFPALNYIIPSRRLRPKKYQIALQMLVMRKKKYDFIVLSSLDVSPLIVALIFLKGKILLYNQWGQWWSLRFRKPSELFKITYVRKKARFSFKKLIKGIGLFFVLLQRKDEEILKHSILIVDNDYALFEHIAAVIRRIKESLPQAKISVLALEKRKEFKDNFLELENIKPGKCMIKRYLIARHMLRLKKKRYDYVILLSLNDITPMIISILFMNGRTLLYNRWHQWWSFRPRSIKSYLIVFPRFIFSIIAFLYLLISVFWIFLRRLWNILKFTLTGRKNLYGN